jgi:hypothetical protein
MTQEDEKQPSPEPEKEEVEFVLVKPKDTSDEALQAAANELFQALQALRAKRKKAEDE